MGMWPENHLPRLPFTIKLPSSAPPPCQSPDASKQTFPTHLNTLNCTLSCFGLWLYFDQIYALNQIKSRRGGTWRVIAEMKSPFWSLDEVPTTATRPSRMWKLWLLLACLLHVMVLKEDLPPYLPQLLYNTSLFITTVLLSLPYRSWMQRLGSCWICF